MTAFRVSRAALSAWPAGCCSLVGVLRLGEVGPDVSDHDRERDENDSLADLLPVSLVHENMALSYSAADPATYGSKMNAVSRASVRIVLSLLALRMQNTVSEAATAAGR